MQASVVIVAGRSGDSRIRCSTIWKSKKSGNVAGKWLVMKTTFLKSATTWCMNFSVTCPASFPMYPTSGGTKRPMSPGSNTVPLVPKPHVPAGQNLRQVMAAPVRESYRAALGDLVDQVSDAELLDSIYLTVFPNFHPWGSFNQIVYRFRPNGDNPDECIMECIFMTPTPTGQARPPAPPIHYLGADDDWVDAPEHARGAARREGDEKSAGDLCQLWRNQTSSLPSTA